MYAIVYNLVRLVMTQSARRQGVAVERICLVDALRWLAKGRRVQISRPSSSTPSDQALRRCGGPRGYARPILRTHADGRA